jgi:hypothetical protein
VSLFKTLCDQAIIPLAGLLEYQKTAPPGCGCWCNAIMAGNHGWNGDTIVTWAKWCPRTRRLRVHRFRWGVKWQAACCHLPMFVLSWYAGLDGRCDLVKFVFARPRADHFSHIVVVLCFSDRFFAFFCISLFQVEVSAFKLGDTEFGQCPVVI